MIMQSGDLKTLKYYCIMRQDRVIEELTKIKAKNVSFVNFWEVPRGGVTVREKAGILRRVRIAQKRIEAIESLIVLLNT